MDALRRKMDAAVLQDVETDMPHLRKEYLGDDFQRLFVELVLQHVRDLLHAVDDPSAEVHPLRLLLLGTAGTGKTHAVQTLLQELKAILQQCGYPGTFCRVAAPTGCAAFNIRFGASTLHRLFDLRNPHKWETLREQSKRLLTFQEKLRPTLLFIFDEVSMIGRCLMGKIDSRCEQATATCIPAVTATLGGKSCILVGDPAQCPPIGDEVFYSCDPHPDTTCSESTRSVLSNRGKLVYDTFQETIILQHCHRIRQLAGDNLSSR